MKMLNVADKQVWSTRSVYNTWKDSLCNLHKQSRIIHSIVKAKFQLPSWPHCFLLACKKGASSPNNCENLKTASEEKLSSTWRQPKTVTLRSVPLPFTHTQSKQWHQVQCPVSVCHCAAKQQKLWTTLTLALLIPQAEIELDVVGQPWS